MTTPDEFWTGEGGTQYTGRNRLDWRKRVPFWRDILDRTGARTVFEVGCNTGYNLTAIKAAAGIMCDIMRTYGVEINKTARRQARLAGHTIQLERADHPQNPLSAYDLTFTCGVLIHVPPENLEATMRGIINMSSQWVLCAEYHAAHVEEVNYRGEDGLLWRRPYQLLYEEMGLETVHSGSMNEPGVWDNVQFALMRKP